MSRDLHEEITNKIISKLEEGVIPWRKSWNGEGSNDLPLNATTSNHYRGINIALLWMAAQDNAYATGEWATYRQWKEKKQQVKKGEKGTTIIYYDKIERLEGDELKEIPFIKASTVFNRCQLDGYEPQAKESRPIIERIENAERYIQNTGATILHDGGNRAFYRRATDDIHLPPRESFLDAQHLYAVTLHEVCHWTGAEHRLNRTKGKKFADKAYAYEELVAELGASFGCAALDICREPLDDHAAYIANWLEVLRGDKKAVFSAASEASKAVEFMDKLQVAA